MQGFQTHTAVQPISIQPLQTQQKPRVTKVQHNAEKHSLLQVCVCPRGEVVSQHALQVVSQHALQQVSGVVSQHALQVSRPTPNWEV